MEVFKCNFCDYESTDLSFHRKHTEIHNDKCQKCSYKAIHTRDLRRHDRVMHRDEEIFACNGCEYTTQYKEKLNEHIQLEHSQQTRSRYFYSTSRNTHNKTNYERYAKKQSFTDTPINCNSCDYKTYSIDDLKNHKMCHNQEKHPKFNGRNKDIDKPTSSCDKCEEKFWHMDEKALHMAYFHERKQQ